MLLLSGSSWAKSGRPETQGHIGSGGYEVGVGCRDTSEPPAFPVVAPRLIAQVWAGRGLPSLSEVRVGEGAQGRPRTAWKQGL